MVNPQTNLDPASAIMEARIHDYNVSPNGNSVTHSKLHLLESGAPSLLLESTDSGGAGTQTRLGLRNAASSNSYDWQIYGKGQRNEGQLAIREIETNTDVLTIKKNGFLGIGTESPNSKLQVREYIQLDVTNGSMPPAGDCNNPGELGRMTVDEVNGLLYLCTASGWISK